MMDKPNTVYNHDFSAVGVHPRGGYQASAPPPNTQNRNLRNKDFVDIMISKVLRDLPFS
jgi:hypothetical protein